MSQRNKLVENQQDFACLEYFFQLIVSTASHCMETKKILPRDLLIDETDAIFPLLLVYNIFPLFLISMKHDIIFLCLVQMATFSLYRIFSSNLK